MTFPPVPLYPKALDSDHTLFLVHNTVEAKIAADNNAWSQEIEILPVEANKPEIWADNGFANIEGELLYYDAVEKNNNGKVFKLKDCARQLGGEKTKFNKRGTWIRSFVVAEHHNQLVDGILKLEDFVGYNFDPRRKTLDWRIRNLQELEIIFDDFACPDINFTWNIIENSPSRGILASYFIEISPPGFASNFRLDFGDGEFTTTELQGQHRYALNSRVDPVITVTNDKCQIIQTPIERSNPAEPPAQVEVAFEIPIPEIPDFPDFTVVPYEIPEPDINLPPLVFPCISLEGQIGPLPSIIEGPDITMVSNVVIEGPDAPVQILHSTVTIIGDVNIPPVVVIDSPPIPPTIIIDPPIPPTIVIVPPNSNITMNLDIEELPRFEVDWGMPPEMEVSLTLGKRIKNPQKFAVDPKLAAEFGEEFADIFEASDNIEVEYETVGIPSEIKIIPPDADSLRIDASDIPERIKIDASEVNIPSNIKIFGPDSPIPNSIRLEGNVPDAIDLVYSGEAIPVKIDTEITVRIEQLEKIPEKIVFEVPESFPDIRIDASQVPDRILLEAPDFIPLQIPENLGIPLILPEEMPEVELVYRGSPIEVKITMEEIMSKTEDKNCVMIVPCTK